MTVRNEEEAVFISKAFVQVWIPVKRDLFPCSERDKTDERASLVIMCSGTFLARITGEVGMTRGTGNKLTGEPEAGQVA